MARPLPKSLDLQNGEQVLIDRRPGFAVAWGRYIFSLGLYAFWASRTYYMLTNRRVIVAKGRLNKIARSVPLEKIQDATISSQLWVGHVVLSTAGGGLSIEKIGPMRTGAAREFINELHAQMDHHAHAKPTTTTDRTAADQIRELGALRDQGLISSEEFEAKKADILSRI